MGGRRDGGAGGIRGFKDWLMGAEGIKRLGVWFIVGWGLGIQRFQGLGICGFVDFWDLWI